MKKPIIILSGCLIFSIALVVTLYAISDNKIRKNNDFTRLFPPHPVNPLEGLPLDHNAYYIAGASDDQLYLGSRKNPARLLVSNFHLTDTQTVTLNIRNGNKLEFRKPKVIVKPPYFYIVDGMMPRLRRGEINTWMADSFMVDNQAFFSDLLPISPSSFAIRTTSSKTGEFAIGKIIPREPWAVLDTTLLQKQIDGKFCTDGMILYDQGAAKIVFVYYYRNQYIIADTSLNLVSRGNTIDTVTHAQLTTANISSEKTYTVSSPPLMVNEASCAANGLLYIKSPLLAKNQSEDELKDADVIDVYDLSDGSYKLSFYLPKMGGGSLEELKIFNNKLIVRSGRWIQTYELNSAYFPAQGITNQKNGI